MNANILVVEDDPSLRRIMQLRMDHNGFKVHCADSGEAGLAALDREPFDLVLSDMVMPGLDGAALAKEIRRRGVRVPILFMSGYPTSVETDGHAFIAKPFTSASLAERVQQEIDRGRAREDTVEVAEWPL